MIDWIDFLEQHSVPYVLGPARNVRQGHVGIACPRCAEDNATHFSLDIISGKVRGCWRDPGHWMTPVSLVASLAGCTMSQAYALVNDDPLPQEVDLGALREQLEGQAEPSPEREPVTFPKHFKRFSTATTKYSSQIAAEEYLRRRGFEKPVDVANEYGLYWSRDPEWQQRIIFPIWSLDGELQGWTARAITPNARLRYKSHPPGDGLGACLWNAASGKGRYLILCEGCFDALPVDVAVRKYNCRASALLGLNWGPRKIQTIARMAAEYEGVVILLDRGAEAQALELSEQLTLYAPVVATVPLHRKDPGEMREGEVLKALPMVTGRG